MLFWHVGEKSHYFCQLEPSKKVYLLNLSLNYGEPAQLHFLGLKRENRVSHLITVTIQLINFRRSFEKLTFAQNCRHLMKLPRKFAFEIEIIGIYFRARTKNQNYCNLFYGTLKQ